MPVPISANLSLGPYPRQVKVFPQIDTTPAGEAKDGLTTAEAQTHWRTIQDRVFSRSIRSAEVKGVQALQFLHIIWAVSAGPLQRLSPLDSFKFPDTLLQVVRSGLENYSGGERPCF